MSNPSDADTLIRRSEAARRLGGIGRDTITKLESEGKLPKVKLTGSDKGHVFYRASDIEALMQPMPQKRAVLRRKA